jgi:hypothetical protein
MDLAVEEVVDGVEEGDWSADEAAVAVGVWPSAVARIGSAANCAETPDEFVQAEFGEPTPDMKFTCIHCRRKDKVSNWPRLELNFQIGCEWEQFPYCEC